MEYRYTDLFASWTYLFYQQIVYILGKENLSRRVNYSRHIITFTNKICLWLYKFKISYDLINIEKTTTNLKKLNTCNHSY
jgi:hypothetical protein